MQWHDLLGPVLARAVPAAVGLIAGVAINAGLLDVGVCRLVVERPGAVSPQGLLWKSEPLASLLSRPAR